MGKQHGNFKNRLGEIKTSNQGLLMKIVAYRSTEDIDIQFEDGTIVFNKWYSCFSKGTIKNPNLRNIFNVGYIGVGEYPVKINYKTTISFSVWYGMLRRCYECKSLMRHPTYKDVTVCEEWHNFQNFAKWFEENYVEGWVLDKDILSKGNKIYSPETCCFVPQEINIAFLSRKKPNDELPMGVTLCGNKYRARVSKNGKEVYLGLYETIEEALEVVNREKEDYIKELAYTWKHFIKNEIYKEMINFKIITYEN